MKRKFYLVSFLLIITLPFLSGCSFFRLHKMSIEQGNIIEVSHVAMLKIGMTEAQVKDIMGEPLVVNLFTPGRVDYVYTYQRPYHDRIQRQVTCIFNHGHLVLIRQAG